MEWTFAGVLARSWALRTAVVCFGLGVALLPLPFVTIADGVTIPIAVVAALVVLAWAIADWGRRLPPYSEGPPAIDHEAPPAPME
jgi:hypothetical protein